MKPQRTHHIKLRYQTAAQPPFDNVITDSRLVIEAFDAVNMSEYIFLMSVAPPSPDAPGLFRSNFEAVCTVSDLEYYPAAVLARKDLDEFPLQKRRPNMLLYVAGENKIYQLTGAMKGNKWSVYRSVCGDEKQTEDTVCKANHLPVDMQGNLPQFYRVSKIDFAIPGCSDPTKILNTLVSHVKNLCERLDYYHTLSKPETVTL